MADFTYLKRYTRPENFADFGDIPRREYYVAYGQHRDSDALARSNFRSMLLALGGESDTVLVIRDSHWAVGWVEAIYVHESATEQLATAESILASLDDYPVADDEYFSELEQEEADYIWKACYSVAERAAYVRKYRSQFEFRTWADVRACLRGDYFAGYASELIH